MLINPWEGSVVALKELSQVHLESHFAGKGGGGRVNCGGVFKVFHSMLNTGIFKKIVKGGQPQEVACCYREGARWRSEGRTGAQ